MNEMTSSNAEITRAIKAAVNRIESDLAAIDSLATDAYRSTIPSELRAKAEASHAKATKAVGLFHKALEKAAKQSGDVTVMTGGGGK